MGSPDEEKEEKEEEEEEDVELVVDESDEIKRDILSAGLELNAPPPMDLAVQEPISLRDTPVQEVLSTIEDFDFPVGEETAVQMAIAPPESEITGPPPPREPPKPRDKILVKADELMSKARQFTRDYKYEEALKEINDRKNLLKKTDYKFEHAQTLLFGGHVFNLIQKYDEAKAFLEEGIEVLKGTTYGKSNVAANLRVELGIAHQKSGQNEEALKAFDQAGTIFKDKGYLSDYIRTLWNKGIAYYNIKDWQNAIETYLEIAKASSEDSREVRNRLRSIQRISDLMHMVGRRGEGDFDTEKYFNEIGKLKDDYEEALAHETRRMTKSAQLERIEASQARDPANLALWHFNLAAAELTARSGKLSSAIEHYNKSIKFYQEIGDKLGLSRCYQHLAYIKERQENFEEATDLLRQCIDLREDLKETIKTEEYRAAIQAETIPIYDELSFLEAKLQRYDASLNAIEQSKSRELINVLANEKVESCPYMKDLAEEEERALGKLRDLEADLYRFRMRYSDVVRGGGTPDIKDREKLEHAISELHDELQDYRRDIWMKCIDTGNTKPPIQYDILSKSLEVFEQEKNWAILEFIWNPNRSKVMAYLITPAGINLYQADLTARELDSLLDEYKKALIEQNEAVLRNSAQVFSEKIIPSEVFNELEKIDNLHYLMIIPHKELHSIPFELILHKNQYWGLKYALVKNFSLDLSRITLQKRNQFLKKHPKMKHSALIAGNPTMDLENAEVEAKEVEEMLKQKDFKVKLLLQKKSKEETFVNSALDQTIIHFAGHGIFVTPEPILSHLRFTSSSLTAREIAQLKLKNIPIVVLSACETAIPGFLGGNELVGFVRSFILAGATTLVSTNWPVSDVSARQLIEKFYKNLLMGASVSVSLQKARQFIAQKYRNQIIHWAAYTLFGDPFRKLIY